MVQWRIVVRDTLLPLHKVNLRNFRYRYNSTTKLSERGNNCQKVIKEKESA